MNFLENKIQNSISYSEYSSLIEKMVANGQTSGLNQTESLAEYTKLNLARMKRIEKTVSVNPHLNDIIHKVSKSLHFLVLAEAWCGDVAQNLPVIHKIINLREDWKMNIVWRDENLDLMNNYLTNGAISIPKVVIIDAADFSELTVWGPRPKAAQQMVMDYKKDSKGVEYMDFVSSLHAWYAEDKGETLQSEWQEIFENLS
jgi:hypothetical protein